MQRMRRTLGHGVDLVRMSRITAVLTRFPVAFPRRILSPVELDCYRTVPAPLQTRFLALRWALKESVHKALHPASVPWSHVTVCKQAGKPCISISGHADVRVHCSASHEGDLLFASVLVESSSH